MPREARFFEDAGPMVRRTSSWGRDEFVCFALFIL